MPETQLRRAPDPDEPFYRIEVDEARRLIEEGGAQVVDVRPAAQYRAAHIPGALNIDADDLFKRRADLAVDRDVVAVCRIGVVSVLGAEILALLGGIRVNLERGMDEWEGRGFPLDRPRLSP